MAVVTGIAFSPLFLLCTLCLLQNLQMAAGRLVWCFFTPWFYLYVYLVERHLFKTDKS